MTTSTSTAVERYQPVFTLTGHVFGTPPVAHRTGHHLSIDDQHSTRALDQLPLGHPDWDVGSLI
jgi:hypothetical protein